jgi:hypothetical protein
MLLRVEKIHLYLNLLITNSKLAITRIVNPIKSGWEIIYHRAHALLAAQLAGQWQRKNAPARLYETLAAISQDGDLEKEWEEDNLTDAGAPMDFLPNGT